MQTIKRYLGSTEILKRSEDEKQANVVKNGRIANVA